MNTIFHTRMKWEKNNKKKTKKKHCNGKLNFMNLYFETYK